MLHHDRLASGADRFQELPIYSAGISYHNARSLTGEIVLFHATGGAL